MASETKLHLYMTINWWKLDLEAEIPNELRVVNDYGNHWLWEPSYSMDEYQRVLVLVGARFYQVS